MKPNAFVGWTSAPTEADVAKALGPAKSVWDAIVVELFDDLGLTLREWKSYGKKLGWALQLRRGKRNILHLGPQEGSFVVLLILGDRAMEKARGARLSAAAVERLDAAPRYPEGTGIRFEPTRAKDLPLILKLARIKLEN